MERLVQYLDDLEDIYFATALLMERMLNGAKLALLLAISFSVQFLGVLLALSRPPMALAFVSLAVVGMLYRNATVGHPAHTLVH